MTLGPSGACMLIDATWRTRQPCRKRLTYGRVPTASESPTTSSVRPCALRRAPASWPAPAISTATLAATSAPRRMAPLVSVLMPRTGCTLDEPVDDQQQPRRARQADRGGRSRGRLVPARAAAGPARERDRGAERRERDAPRDPDHGGHAGNRLHALAVDGDDARHGDSERRDGGQVQR